MKIRGNTVGTTMKRPDFKQKDPKKSDFIKNNPIPDITEKDEGKIPKVVNGKYELTDDFSPKEHTHDIYQSKEDDKLQTTDKTVVGAINNLQAMVEGNTWRLNNPSGSGFTKTFEFESNGLRFNKIQYLSQGTSSRVLYVQADGTETTVYYYGEGWKDEAWRTINTTDDIDLNDIAEKIESPKLNTEAVSLIGATNELKDTANELKGDIYKLAIQEIEFKGAHYNKEDGKWYEKYVNDEFLDEIFSGDIRIGETKIVLFDIHEVIDLAPDFNWDFKVEGVKGLVDFIKQMWSIIPEGVQNKLLEKANEVIEDTKEGLTELKEKVEGGIEATVNEIYSWFTEGPEAFEDFAEAANAKIQEFGKETKEDLSNLQKDVTDNVKTKLDKIGDYAYGWVTDTVNEAIDLAKQAATDAAEALEEGLTDLYNEVTEDISAGIDNAKETLNTNIQNAKDNLNESLGELKDDINENVKAKLKEAQDWINDTGDGIKKWVDDTGKQAVAKVDEIVEFFGGDLVPDQNFAQITSDKYTAFVKNNSIDTLDTNEKTVAGSINELNKILKGNTWVLNNTFNFQANFKKDFVFVSNGATFKAIEGIFGWDESSEEYYYQIYYWKPDETKVLVYTDGLGWSWKPKYQTIFTYNTGILLKDIATIKNEAIVGAIKKLGNEIENETSALQQAIEEGRIIPKCALEAQNLRDEDQLETDANTVIDAINELARQALNTLGYIHTHYDNPQNIKETASGITWRDKYELDAGIVRIGDIYHKVPIVAGNNVSFEVDETNKVVKINANTEGIVQAVIDALPKYDGEVMEIYDGEVIEI